MTTKIKLQQQPYIDNYEFDDRGAYFSSAILADNTSSGVEHQYYIRWPIVLEGDDFANETDESNMCNWDKFEIKDTNGTILESDNFEIVG